ncbi:MAG: DUF2182 domain-containing protein [Hoeflea sp.]|uniref:copper chaperone n=1 Tax=Hoeflea sp. TaxID=1940281 RepID=UPI003EF400E3
MMSTETRRKTWPTVYAFPAAIAALSWAYILAGAGMEMSLLAMTTPLIPPPMDLQPSTRSRTVADALLITGMWWAMMLAMMVPGLLLKIARRSPPSPRYGVRFFAGYGLAWLVFCVPATALQSLLEHAGWLHSSKMWSISKEFSVSILVFAGVYQFLPVKHASLIWCDEDDMNPHSLATGIRHGLDCLTKTAPMMLLLFVGGVMNLYWIAGLSLLATLEKALTHPRPVAWFAGLLWLVLAGAIRAE